MALFRISWRHWAGGPTTANHFINNQGTQGLQFAAVDGTAYNLAKARDWATRWPLEWFTQKIRD